MTDPALPLDLGDGLRLRSASAADADRLAAFNGELHGDAPGAPDESVAAWTHDLLARPHPTFRPDLFTIVEDAGSGRIVSTLNLIPQTWSYGGVEFGVGRIELVGTHPDYRRRGLVRRQMDVAHAWSAGMGHLVQGITGIPWYYRQFGYEMTLALDDLRRVPIFRVPELKEGAEPFRLRPATAADAPFLAATDAAARRRSLLAAVRDEAIWRYEMEGRSEASDTRRLISIIEPNPGADADPPAPVGYLVHVRRLWQDALWTHACELAPGSSWAAVAPPLLRSLRATGLRYAEAPPAPDAPAAGPRRCDQLVFELGSEHPLYALLPDRARQVHRPYTWYLRVPDLPAFVRRVAPVLEARLAASPVANFSGELRLNFYRDGLRLRFAAGRLTDIQPWPNPDRKEASASFPPLTFLHLLFGHRSLSELEQMFADCGAQRSEESRTLVESLFPPQPSAVRPID